MRLPFFAAVFSMFLVGPCATAGVILDASEMQARVTNDWDAVMVILASSDEPAPPPPIEVGHGDSDSLHGLANSFNSSFGQSASLCSGVTLRPDGGALWRIRLANPVLPPSPDLDGLLEPS